MNWSQLITNVIAAGGGAGTIVAFVPPKYQPLAAMGLALAANLAGLFQRPPHE